MSALATAQYFTAFDVERLSQLIINAPYEKKDKSSGPNTYVRGYIKTYLPGQGPPNDIAIPFVFTGPKMRVAYSGCRWNQLVFSVDDSGEVQEFGAWLDDLNKVFKNVICASPDKYKPGSKVSNFTFKDSLIQQSSDPNLYPPELRTRLSTYRVPGGENDLVDADLFKIEDGHYVSLFPGEITAGSYVIPVFKVNYFRNGTNFGLNMTVIKARVWLNDLSANRIENKDWVIDTPVDMEEEN